MNREIKFRAWGDIDSENPTMEYDPQWRHTSDCRLSTWFSMRGYHIMQFTGLTDKNGVEIYEGDVVKDPTIGFFGIVQFGTFTLTKDSWGIEHIAAGWHMDFTDGSGSTAITTEFEIIGNIHEHPNLLK